MFPNLLTALGIGSNHMYTLAASGIKFRSKSFQSREAAKRSMYEFIDRKGLKIKDKWVDGHYRTYVCEDGVKFYINRF